MRAVLSWVSSIVKNWQVKDFLAKVFTENCTVLRINQNNEFLTYLTKNRFDAQVLTQVQVNWFFSHFLIRFRSLNAETKNPGKKNVLDLLWKRIIWQLCLRSKILSNWMAIHFWRKQNSLTNSIWQKNVNEPQTLVFSKNFPAYLEK